MEITKKDLEAIKKDPLMNLILELLDVSMEKSHTKLANDVNPDLCKDVTKPSNNMADNYNTNCTAENTYYKSGIKNVERFHEPENPESLVDDNLCEEGRSFSMTKEELNQFVKDYTKLENTFRKLEHTFGVDLNANADSIYTQYNAIVWNLIEKIFGEDNRDDIADYCFGDSNFDTVEDLYEELV
jgi:hypothetical protein